MDVPRISKIVVNIGVGKAAVDKKLIKCALNELTLMTGQKAIATIAKNSISNFKLREGQEIGCKVTLRNKKMYDFLDKLIKIVIPRVRDFRGYSNKSFDSQGNYNFGISEQIVFPEINFDDIKNIQGLNITIVINSNNIDYNYNLLLEIGFPIRKRREL